MKNLLITSVFAILVTVSVNAFANGVEKVLPADASNLQLKAAAVAYVPTGNDGGNAQEGTPGSASGSKAILEVSFVYSSKSTQDVPSTGSGLDGQVTDADDVRPQFAVDFDISDDLAKQIAAGKVSAASLFSYAVQTESVQVQEPVQYHCQYLSTNDGGSFEKADPSCQEPDGITTENRPVVTVSLK